MKELIRNIQKGMEYKGLTQKALALKAGKNETAVRDILKGLSKDPQVSTVDAIAKIFGCTMDSLCHDPSLFRIEIKKSIKKS